MTESSAANTIRDRFAQADASLTSFVNRDFDKALAAMESKDRSTFDAALADLKEHIYNTKGFLDAREQAADLPDDTPSDQTSPVTDNESEPPEPSGSTASDQTDSTEDSADTAEDDTPDTPEPSSDAPPSTTDTASGEDSSDDDDNPTLGETLTGWVKGLKNKLHNPVGRDDSGKVNFQPAPSQLVPTT